MDGNDRNPKVVPKSLNDELMDCSLNMITRGALLNSKDDFDKFDYQGRSI